MRRVILMLLIATLWTAPMFAQSSDSVSQAKRQVSQADNERHKAIIALSKEAARIRKQIEDTAEWKQAEAALKDGQAKHNTAVAGVRRALKPNPEYQRAQKRYLEALEEREALRSKADATPEQRVAAATACLTASSAIAHIEQKAIADDPAADQAHMLMQQATDQIEELKKRFSAVAQKDSAYQVARQHVSAAEAQLVSAESALTQAKAADARDSEAKTGQEIDAINRTLMKNAGTSR